MARQPAGRVFLVLALVALPTRVARALEPGKALTQYTISVWKTSDGLPMNSVQALAQTADGSIWIGTEEGVARFDGVTFAVYDRGNSPGLPGHNVQALCAGDDGLLWAGTWGSGLLVWDGHSFAAWKGGRPLSASVTSVVKDRDGSIWIGSARGLERIAGGRAVPLDAGDGLASAAVKALAAGGGGRIWVATDSGLGVVEQGALRRIGPRPAPQGIVLALCESPDGNLLVGTDQGLWEIAANLEGCTKLDGLRSDFVSAILFDRHGGLWIGTNGGVHRRRRDGSFEALTTREGLSSNLVQRLLEDREGSLWIATRGGGLDRLGDGDFTSVGAEALPPVIDTVLAARRGGVWLGGWSGTLAHLSADGHVERRASARVLAGSSVRALCETPDGTLYIGAWSGLYRMRDGRVASVHADQGLRNVRSVLVDRRGAIWVGLESEGLVRLDRIGTRRFTTADGLGGNQVRALLEEPDGTLWVATYGGLSRFTGNGFETLTSKDGLPSDLVRCLYRDGEGALWVGTYGGGIARLAGGRISAWDMRDGLYTDVAYGITEDAAGNLWVGSNRGVYRVSRHDLEARSLRTGRRLRCRSFGEADGMASAECNGGDPAVARDLDGRLYFPTVRGVAFVDPARLITPSPPEARIESALVEGRPLAPGAPAEIPSGAKRFEFRYAALNLRSSKVTEFRYRLDGFDEQWVAAGPRRAAFYTNIPPGSYTFRVVAGIDGTFGRSESTFAFRLARVWWQTWWAQLTLALALAGLAALGVHLRTRALERDRRSLEAAVASRSAELAAANRELEEVAVTDPLTKAKNRRYFDMAIEGELELAVRRAEAPGPRTNRDVVLYIVDLDHFKEVNDTWGHHAGDLVLVETARRLHGALRKTDFLVRWGGEEFLVLARASDRRKAQTQAERMLFVIGDVPFEVEGKAISRTCSIGWAPFPWLEDLPKNVAFEDVVGLADRALYEAKASGRNRAIGYLPADGPSAPDDVAPFELPAGHAVRIVRVAGHAAPSARPL